MAVLVIKDDEFYLANCCREDAIEAQLVFMEMMQKNFLFYLRENLVEKPFHIDIYLIEKTEIINGAGDHGS